MAHSHGNSRPLTDKQKIVLDALMKSDVPLSAYALLDQLRDDGFRAPLQVYRALEKLTEGDYVHRLESLNAFVACRHSGCDTEAPHTVLFAICERCNRVQEESDPSLFSTLSTLAERANFSFNSSVIELKGLCADCKAS